MKFDAAKSRVDLIMPEFLIELGRLLAYGAIKYAPNNWCKGAAWSRYYGALQRHALAWQSGESIDPESKCHHLAAVAFNAMCLYIYELHGLGTDDRWKSTTVNKTEK